MTKDTIDYLIIGAGVVGLTTALRLRSKFPNARILVLEKEKSVGFHASGRNSGVLHAGFYYDGDSFKARFCRQGNAAWKAYCRERGLALRECGKLVPARNEKELSGLQTLLARGRANGVELEMISDTKARDLEPNLRVHEAALWSPSTASVDPNEIMARLAEECAESGIRIALNEAYVSGNAQQVVTHASRYEYGFLINASGLYADRIARDFGFSKNCAVLPFRGLYLYGEEGLTPYNTHIYPVPDLRFPFLGVHFTVTVTGRNKIGPTAFPAFWREQYQGLERFEFGEFLSILKRMTGLLFSANFNFRGHTQQEIRKQFRPFLLKDAASLVTNLKAADYRQFGRPGIRAQLVDLEERKLVMDFKLAADGRSLHVLNAISPAFTCAWPFADFLLEEIEKHRAF